MYRRTVTFRIQVEGPAVVGQVRGIAGLDDGAMVAVVLTDQDNDEQDKNDEDRTKGKCLQHDQFPPECTVSVTGEYY